MVKNNVYELLLQNKKSKYWLRKQLDTSWDNMSRILLNENSSISYEFINTLCQIFNCKPGDLFTYTED